MRGKTPEQIVAKREAIIGQLEEAADTTGPPAVRTNAYGNELLKYVDVAMGRDGFGGIYMDESIYSESPRNFNALVWDGVSGIVDPINGSVIRTFADTTLLWAPMKLAIYERIRSRGGRAMANCAPVTEEVIADGAANTHVDAGLTVTIRL